VLGLLASVGAVLAPKCPLCLAVYLSAWGLGVGAAETVSRVAPLLLPLGVALGVVALFLLARALRRRWRALNP
jgi:hypothetical protein